MLNDNRYPVTDGFLLNVNLRCDLQFLSLVLSQYDNLRRSVGMRSRTWVAPEDTQLVSVPPYDSYEYQIRVKPGSAIWGYRIVINPQATGSYSFQVRESCTGVPLFSEPISITAPNRSNSYQYPLSRLFVVPEPGLLAVEICNQGADNLNGIQLLLDGGEPADVPCEVCP